MLDSRRSAYPAAIHPGYGYFVVILAALFSCSCATLSGEKTHSAERAETGDENVTAEFRVLYDEGFSLVMRSFLNNSTNPKYRLLSDIKRFREQAVRWARFDGDRYHALEAGRTDGAWLAIIPVGRSRAQERRNTLQIESNPNIHVVRIQPDKITRIWAGIFLIHELSHLADRVTQFEPVRPTREQYLHGEARAYKLELMSVNLVSQDAFDRRLDTILEGWRAPSTETLVGKLKAIQGSELNILDSVVTDERSKSDSEKGLRSGFYVLALFLRFVEKNNAGMDDFLRGLNKLLLNAAWSDDPYRW